MIAVAFGVGCGIESFVTFESSVATGLIVGSVPNIDAMVGAACGVVVGCTPQPTMIRVINSSPNNVVWRQ